MKSKKFSTLETSSIRKLRGSKKRKINLRVLRIISVRSPRNRQRRRAKEKGEEEKRGEGRTKSSGMQSRPSSFVKGDMAASLEDPAGARES